MPTRYLLDTNVVSEFRRRRPHRRVLEWLRAVDEASLFVSAVTVGEIQRGIEIVREQDSAKSAEIEAWLEEVLASNDVLSMDGPAFRLWARLMHRQPRALAEDAMIAATAILNGLTVVTRNLRDFDGFGVPTLDPFAPPRKGA